MSCPYQNTCYLSGTHECPEDKMECEMFRTFALTRVREIACYEDDEKLVRILLEDDRQETPQFF